MFKALHQFAQATPLILTIVPEGEQLRVTVVPQMTAGAKSDRAPHPLSLLATPEDLDANFSSALGIYAPSTLSLLEQAQVAADANAGKASTSEKASKPAGGAPRGRRVAKAADGSAAVAAPSGATEGEGAGEPVDDRTLALPLEAADPQADAAPTSSPAATPEAAQAQPSEAPTPASEPESLDIAI